MVLVECARFPKWGDVVPFKEQELLVAVRAFLNAFHDFAGWVQDDGCSTQLGVRIPLCVERWVPGVPSL